MKTIIAGSRNIQDYGLIEKAVKASKFIITEVVCGGANGVDRLGASWAMMNNIPVKYFLAEWDRYSKGAGTIRNRQMADYADSLIAIWDGNSPGTGNMIKEAKIRKLHTYILIGDQFFASTVGLND